MRLRRLRSRLPLLFTVAAFFAAAAIYIYGMAWIQSIGLPRIRPSDLWGPRLIDALIVFWLLWVGSAIGSFLNVVAWRMPRGISINGQSRCPFCNVLLKAQENLPVVGWISLNGRCGTCRLPISPRYPIVEATVGVMLTLVGVAELYRMAIPGQWTHWHGGPFWAPVVDQPLLVLLVYHTVALAISWAFGLIRFDRNGLPWRLVLFAIIALVTPIIVSPALMIVPWQMTLPDQMPNRLDAVMRVTTALVAAGVFGRSLARGLCPNADPKLDPLGSGTARLIDLIVILAVPALVVGWQTLPAVIVLASLIAMALRRVLPTTCDVLGCFALSIPVALTFQICLWRRLHNSEFWPSIGSSPWLLLFAGALVLLIPAWLREPPTPVVHVDPPSEADEVDEEDDAPIEESSADNPSEVDGTSE